MVAVWAEWSVFLDLDRPGYGNYIFGNDLYPSSDSGESQRAAIIGEDPHLAFSLASGRLSLEGRADLGSSVGKL